MRTKHVVVLPYHEKWKQDFIDIKTVKYLDDNATYLGNQLECEFGGDRCFGIAANMEFILICTYEENGENPELVVYKNR